MGSQIVSEHKHGRLSIRASETEKSLLERAARVRRMNTSQFVLQASLTAAESVLFEQTIFTLPPEQWKAFCDRLDAPARVIPALQELLSRPEPFDD
jgi:uncharacterized protein (DUF1778 family)